MMNEFWFGTAMAEIHTYVRDTVEAVSLQTSRAK